MTCDEFQSQSEQRVDTAASEHLENCAACRALHYEREQLRNAMEMVRNSAPECPQSLDAVVMNAFGREMAVRVAAPKRGISARLAWAAIAAGALIAASFFLVAYRKPESAANQVHQPAPQQIAKASADAVDAAPKSVAHPRTMGAHSKRGTVRPVLRKQPTETVSASTAPEDGFQNLMYCDALSCSGDMQMIRIQLPASAIHRFPPARPSNGFVQADVVVGSDGIARAIRIVK